MNIFKLPKATFPLKEMRLSTKIKPRKLMHLNWLLFNKEEIKT